MFTPWDFHCIVPDMESASFRVSASSHSGGIEDSGDGARLSSLSQFEIPALAAPVSR